MILRYLSLAAAELNEAAQWYEDRQPGLGDRFLHAVADAVDAICQDPLRHPPLPRTFASRTVFRRLLKGFPYGIVYEVRADELLVLAVAHTSRRPNYWNRRS